MAEGLADQHRWAAFGQLPTGRAASSTDPAVVLNVDRGAVEAAHGIPATDADVVVRLSTSPCTNVRDEFCPLANLFCDRDHLEAWQGRTPDASGEVLDLEGFGEPGRRWWSRSAGCCDAGPPGGR